MDAHTDGAVFLNSILNAVNLALTAWIISATNQTKRDLRKNTRITAQAADSATEVRDKTNGALEALLQRMENAARRAEEAAKKQLPSRGRTKPKRKKPRPRK